MIQKFSIATLLAASAFAFVEDPCCIVYSGEVFSGNNMKLCLDSTETQVNFNLALTSVASVQSFECGENTRLSYCDSTGACVTGEYFIQADGGPEITLSYRDTEPVADSLMQLNQGDHARGTWALVALSSEPIEMTINEGLVWD